MSASWSNKDETTTPALTDEVMLYLPNEVAVADQNKRSTLANVLTLQSGSGYWDQIKLLPNDFVKNNDATITSIADLDVAASSVGTYQLEYRLIVESNVADYRFTGSFAFGTLGDAVLNLESTDFKDSAFTANHDFLGTGFKGLIILKGFLDVTVAGVVSLNFGQQIANASDSTVFAGSTVSIKQVV